jgi:hypothetical protein
MKVKPDAAKAAGRRPHRGIACGEAKPWAATVSSKPVATVFALFAIYPS